MALLAPVSWNSLPIAGVLVDVGKGGFRAKHSYGGLQRNQIVSFIHQSREGVARVIWNRATGPDFETGFKYLNDSGD